MGMPELRKDAVAAGSVIIAPERQGRPSDYGPGAAESSGARCPFCPGNEDLTPSEIMAHRPEDIERDKPGWTLRVVPNKYPALVLEDASDQEDGNVYGKASAVGAHEVIIESPDHGATLSKLSVSALEAVLAAYRARLLQLARDPRLRYGLVFKNHGEAAGATLEHTHSQIIALSMVPHRVAAEHRRCKSFFDLKKYCFFCDVMRREAQDTERLVLSSSGFQVFSPYASRFSFEMWILPKRHSAAFEATTPAELEDLAQVFSQTLRRLDKALGNPAYSFVLRTAPFGADAVFGDYYHWRFEIMPRLARLAGFELGTGLFINPMAPERAAAILRDDRPYEHEG